MLTWTHFSEVTSSTAASLGFPYFLCCNYYLEEESCPQMPNIQSNCCYCHWICPWQPSSINQSWSPFQWKETQCFRILRQVSVQPLSILWCWGKRRDLFSTVFRMNPSPASIFQHVFSRPRERGQRTCGFSLSFFFFWLKFLFLIPIDLENELMVTGVKGGKDRLGVWDWHVHTAICKITNKGLLHSTGNSA